MNEKDLVYLKHILEVISHIEESTSELSREEFDSDLDAKDATLRRIEVIGEAVKNLSDELRNKYPKIEWRKIAGTRDVIIHAYFNVDWNLVWNIIRKDIVGLKNEIRKIIDENSVSANER